MSTKFRLVTALITALLMSMFMSFVFAVINVGFSDILLFAWLRGWGIGFAIAMPVAFFLPPNIAKLVRKMGIK